MRLERITNHSFHIMDAGAFLGSFHSPERAGGDVWRYMPTERYLTEHELNEIARHLKQLNSLVT